MLVSRHVGCVHAPYVGASFYPPVSPGRTGYPQVMSPDPIERVLPALVSLCFISAGLVSVPVLVLDKLLSPAIDTQYC